MPAAILIPAAALFVGVASAGSPVEAQTAAVEGVRPDAPPPGGFTAIGLLQTRAVQSNIVTTNPLINGQVVGVLGGMNGTTVLPEDGLDLDGDGEADEDVSNSAFVEQRATAFLTWAPQVFAGRATLSSAFEVDFLWGDASYGVGGNAGGGFGADQVNLQTRRMHATFKPTLGPRHAVDIVAGLQFVSDGVYNPAASTPDDLFRAGGGLKFWGSEAAGITAFGRIHSDWGDHLRYRLGTYTLAEQVISVDDDVALHMADVQWQPGHRSRIGLHGWWLRDRAGGNAGIIGSGPASSLSEFQGGPMLNLKQGDQPAPIVDADLVWLGVDGGLNHGLHAGPIGVTGGFFTNVGKLYVEEQTDITVQGWLGSGEVRYRWAAGKGSVLRLEALASSRDGNGRDAYTGVITGNSYGVVGAVWATHGTFLLMPDPMAVNRQTSVVYDVSNRGDGLRAITGSAGWDAVPNRVTVQLGGAHATTAQGDPMGTELNAQLITHPFVLTDLGFAAATVKGSAFDADPWLVMAHLEWLLF